MKKKCLMIICSRFQLLQAIHIKRKLLENEIIDVVLASTQFDRDIKTRLKGLFENIWTIEGDYFSKRERIFFWFLPICAIRSIGITQPERYTDIFFWNPGHIFYYFRKNALRRKIPYKWHIFQDGQGNYLVDESAFGDFQNYTRGILGAIARRIDKKRYTIPLLFECDEYIWKPDLRLYKANHKIIDVPVIDLEDRAYIRELNYIFGYEKKSMDDEYIYIDSSHGFFDDAFLLAFVKELGEKIAPQKITIIPHPGVNTHEFDSIKKYIHVDENRVPWELVCMNEDIRKKKLIGCYSSALFFPFVLFDSDVEAYSFSGAMNPEKCILSKEWIDKFSKLNQIIEKNNPHFHNVLRVEEIVRE